METKLQVWGTEIDGRVHSVLLACEEHSAIAQLKAAVLNVTEADVRFSRRRLVRLAHLDDMFPPGSSACFACPMGDVVPAVAAREWVYSEEFVNAGTSQAKVTFHEEN